MDTNLNLSIGFKGQLKLTAQVVPLQEGYLKLGGLVDATNQPNGLDFGLVVSANPDDTSQIVAGLTAGNIVRGISVFDDAIAQNAPAHSGKYLAGMPCAFVSRGLVKITDWQDGKDPVIGYKVQFEDATGKIGFVESSADTDNTLLTGAEVVEVTGDGAYVWLG